MFWAGVMEYERLGIGKDCDLLEDKCVVKYNNALMRSRR